MANGNAHVCGILGQALLLLRLGAMPERSIHRCHLMPTLTFTEHLLQARTCANPSHQDLCIPHLPKVTWEVVG